MANTYEIEVKSLLGSKENANRLREEIKKRGANLLKSNKQLNHYFVVEDQDGECFDCEPEEVELCQQHLG